MSSVGSSLAIVTVAASTCFVRIRGRSWSSAARVYFLRGLWLSCSPNPLRGNRNVTSRREDRDPPDDGDDGTSGDRGNRGKMARA